MCDTVINALSALGTIGACIISLVLAYGKYKHKLDCVFIWGTPNDYNPTLLVNNLCSRTIIISEIKVYYANKAVATFDLFEDYQMKDSTIIPAGSEKQIILDADKFSFPNLNLNNTSADRKKRTLKIVVRTSYGKRFVSKQKYSRDGVFSLLIGYGLLGKD